MLALSLALQLFAASADGQAYLPQGKAALHTTGKALGSLAVYGLLRGAKVAKPVSVVVSTLGVFVVAKAIEVAKGHRLGPWDTVHDGLTHASLVLPVATRKTWTVSVGLAVVATCRQSAPRWC